MCPRHVVARQKTLFFVLLITLTATTATPGSATGMELFQGGVVAVPATAGDGLPVGVLRSDGMNLRREALQAVVRGEQIKFNFASGRKWVAVVRERTKTPGGATVLRGDFEDAPGSNFYLVGKRGAWVGDAEISSEEKFWIRAAEGEVALVVQVETRDRPACGGTIRLNPADLRKEVFAARPSTRLPSPTALAPGRLSSAPPTFDVLVVYTMAARMAAGGAAVIEAQAELAMAKANQAYHNSNIAAHGVIAGTTEINFTETGNYIADVSTLRRDIGVQALRDSVNADFVSLFVSRYDNGHNFAGYAYIMQSFSIQYEQLAFSIVQFHEAGITNLFAHELGHNMGCDHNIENAAGFQVERDAYGWHFSGRDGIEYGTVMSYRGTPTYNFSDPAIYYQETATGVLGQANNAAVIRSTLPYFTRFRPVVSSGTVAVIATQPVAGASAGQVGTFTFTRSGGIMELPLDVFPSTAGTAQSNVDYTSEGFGTDSTGTGASGVPIVRIPAFQSTADVLIQPNGSGPNNGAKTVIVTLPVSPDYDYSPGASATATITVLDHGPSLPLQPPPVPRASLINISTRLRVGAGDDVGIAGFVVIGAAPKRFLIRALGPTLISFGVSGTLANPSLELHDASTALIEANDDWPLSLAQADILASGLAPADPAEPAIVRTLAPGAYTAIARGVDGGSGVSLIEVYDLSPGVGAHPINVSTRGRVETGDSVMIGGFVVRGDTAKRVIVRALGPSLTARGVSGALADPTLELYDGVGNLVITNDNWQDSQAAEIAATPFPPASPTESAIVLSLAPGAYTAIVRGKNGTTGTGLIEVYDLDP